MTDTPPAPVNQSPMTEAGASFLTSLTVWLQDVRFAGEAIYRLDKDYQSTKMVAFSAEAWPPPSGQEWTNNFSIREPHLGNVAKRALRVLWETRFVFLETLWEEYLQRLVLEIRVKNVTLFEEFAARNFMIDLIRQVISDKWASVEDIKIEVASRFAAELTHKSWSVQWQELVRLSIGLSKTPPEFGWYSDLDSYFEMRNCIIHRKGRASARLKELNSYYAEHDFVHVYPTHLGYYRAAFMSAVTFIDSKVLGKLGAS